MYIHTVDHNLCTYNGLLNYGNRHLYIYSRNSSQKLGWLSNAKEGGRRKNIHFSQIQNKIKTRKWDILN